MSRPSGHALIAAKATELFGGRGHSGANLSRLVRAWQGERSRANLNVHGGTSRVESWNSPPVDVLGAGSASRIGREVST